MTLKNLKEYIYKINKLLVFENDEAVLKLISNEKKYLSQNNQNL